MIRYDHFEKQLLQYCIGLNIEELLSEKEEDRKSERNHLESSINAINAQFEKAVSQIENLTNIIAETNLSNG